jgi:hypothetical protein
MTKLEMKLPALTREFDLCIQTEDGNEYVVRFEDGNCVGCWNTAMPEDEKANLEIMQAKALIDRNVDLGWLTSYGPALKTGKFEYTVWDGYYEAKREREMGVAA